MSQATKIPELNTTDMMNVLKRLCFILKQEIELIKEMKLGQLHVFDDEKRKLIAIMESYKEVLKNNPAIVESIPKVTMNELKKVNQEFETMLEQDGKQLVKAKKVHSIVMDALKKALENYTKQNSGYNSLGLFENQGKKKILLTPSVSISESF